MTTSGLNSWFEAAAAAAMATVGRASEATVTFSSSSMSMSMPMAICVSPFAALSTRRKSDCSRARGSSAPYSSLTAAVNSKKPASSISRIAFAADHPG